MKKTRVVLAAAFTVITLLLAVSSCAKPSGAGAPTSAAGKTPEEIIGLYVDSLQKGDYKTVNEVMSKRFLSAVNDGKGYSSLPSLKISDVAVKPLDTSGLNPDIAKKYGNLPPTECYYELSYTIGDSPDAGAFGGTGEHYYFVRLLQEDDIWKIDTLSTSP